MGFSIEFVCSHILLFVSAGQEILFVSAGQESLPSDAFYVNMVVGKRGVVGGWESHFPVFYLSKSSPYFTYFCLLFPGASSQSKQTNSNSHFTPSAHLYARSECQKIVGGA